MGSSGINRVHGDSAFERNQRRREAWSNLEIVEMLMQPEEHKFLYWQRRTDIKKDYFMYYKTSLAVVLMGMFIYGYSDQQYNPKDVYGDDRDEIYPFLKYKDDFSSALKFDLMMTFGIQSVVFCVLYCLNKLKLTIFKKCSKSYPDGMASESQTGLIEKDPLDSRFEFSG